MRYVRINGSNCAENARPWRQLNMKAIARDPYSKPALCVGLVDPPLLHDNWRWLFYRSQHDEYARNACLKSNSGLESVFSANRALLARFVRVRLRADDAVDDLLQELWVKVHSVDTGPIAEPLAYLYRMAENLVLDRKRAEARRMARDRAWSERRFNGASLETDPTPNPEQIAVARDFLERVKARLDGLPDRTAAIFHAVRVEKRPQKELATELGISVSAVEKHLQRAYREIIIVREELEGEPPSSESSRPERVAHGA